MIILARKAAVLAAALVFGATASLADTLTPNGTVMINQGNGYQSVTGPTQVGPGDMIMVNSGTAQVTTANGTVLSLEPGQVYTIGSLAGAGTGTAVAGTGAGLSTTTLIVGGVVVAGGAAAAIAASSKGSSKKSSSP